MSTDWDVYCEDCDAYAGISDANHRNDLMRVLIAHAGPLAELSQVKGLVGYMELSFDGHHVDLDFFAAHRGHRLRPISEYGYFEEKCGQEYFCPRCQKTVKCEDYISAPSRSYGSRGHGHVVNRFWHFEGDAPTTTEGDPR